MIEVELPNGTSVEIDTDDPNIAQQAAQRFIQTQQPLSSGEKAIGLIGQLGQGASFGLVDEAAAGLTTPIVAAMRGQFTDVSKYPEIYGENLDIGRGLLDRTRKEMPIASTGANIIGGITNVKALGDAAPSLFAANTIGRTTAAGTLTGAGYGFGEGEGLGDRARQAAIGGVLGGATSAATYGLLNSVLPQPQMGPTNESLKQSAQNAYQAAEDAGISFKKGAYNSFVDDVISTLQKEGVDSELTPGAARVLSRIQDGASKPVTLQEAETLRKVIGTINPSNPADYRLGTIIRDKLDDFVEGAADAGNMTKGSDSAGIDALKNAREYWKQLKKNEIIDNVFDKIENVRAPSTEEMTAIKQRFRNLADNKKLMRSFNKEEQAAIRSAAKTGFVEGALRLGGSLDPFSGKLPLLTTVGGGLVAGGAGVLSTAVPAAGAVANPWLGALPVGGLLSNLAYRGMAADKANYARGLIRGAGQQVPTLFQRGLLR